MKNVGSLAGGIRLEGTCYMSREGERMCVWLCLSIVLSHFPMLILGRVGTGHKVLLLKQEHASFTANSIFLCVNVTRLM